MRCYNGCPDKELQAYLDAQTRALKALKKLNPKAHVTFFPCEEKYHVHEMGHSLSGMHFDYVAACEDAIRRIKNSSLT